MQLQSGDCLLYRPRGIFGRIIQVKTWHRIAHVEIYSDSYQGVGHSWASRDGLGVDLYPWRNTELEYVLRPRSGFDLPVAHDWAVSKVGTPYGWLDLLNFVGITERGKGLFCSEFATYYYRAGGLNVFPVDDPAQIAPFQFLDLVGFAFDVVARGPVQCASVQP